MKKTRSLIIMLVILAVLLGGFALVKILGEPSGSTDETEESAAFESKDPLIKVSAEDVEKITLENESGTLSLKPVFSRPTPTPKATGEGADEKLPVTGKAEPTPLPDVLNWQVTEPEIENLSQEAANDLGSDLMLLSIVEDLGTKNEEEMAHYGLDEPSARAVYELKNGEKHEFLLGDRVSASSTEKYYAMDKDKMRVTLVSSAADRMQTSYLSLVDKDIFAFETGDIFAFEMERAQDDFTLAAVGYPEDKEEDTEDDAAAGHPAAGDLILNWQMTSPVEWEGNAMTINNFLGELVQLKAERYMPYSEEEAADYGFDSPQYRIRLKTESGDKTLVIGQNISDTEAYGRIDGSPYLFTFNRSLLTQTGQPVLDFYGSFAALVNITDVGRLTLVLDGEDYVSEVFNPTTEEIKAAEEAGKEKPEPHYTLNGKNANYQNEKKNNLFTKYYQALIAVKVAGFDTEAHPDADDAIYSITYEMRNEDEDIHLDFVPRDEKTLYLIKNGAYTELYVSRKDFTSDESVDSPGVIYALQLLEDGIRQQEAYGTAASTTEGKAA